MLKNSPFRRLLKKAQVEGGARIPQSAFRIPQWTSAVSMYAAGRRHGHRLGDQVATEVRHTGACHGRALRRAHDLHP